MPLPTSSREQGRTTSPCASRMPAGNTATDDATITVIAEPDDIIIYFEDFESELGIPLIYEGQSHESSQGLWTIDDLGAGSAGIASAGNCNTGTNYDASFSIRSDAYGQELTWTIKNSGGGYDSIWRPLYRDLQSVYSYRNCVYSRWRVHTRVE